MQRCISIALFALLSFAPLEAEVRHLDVSWADLVSAIEGHPVELVLRDSTAVKGYVRSVTPDALELDIITTSNGRAQPKSPASLPRSTVNTLQYTLVRGNWTALGTAIGAGAGSGVGAPAAIPISNEGPFSRAAGVVAGALGAGAAAGFVAGRASDRETTIIRIVD